MATVLMKSTAGAFALSFDLPNGQTQVIAFKEKVKGDGEFVAEVPTRITFKDAFNNTKVFHENYADFVLNVKDIRGNNVYPLEIVEVMEKPVVEKKSRKKGTEA